MSYWIYSSEALPNQKFMGKPGYSPDGEYIRVAGATLPPIPEKEWMKLPDVFTTVIHRDWTDKQGQEIEIPIRRFKAAINGSNQPNQVGYRDHSFASRGVIFLDHEPTKQEKEKLEAVSEELNIEYRKKMVEFFESERQAALARQGRFEATPYIDECYEVLKMRKPYSADALKAQRNPGDEAATRIANAMKEALGDFSLAIQEAMTTPKAAPAGK